jgi:hypothetical protein
MLDMSMHLCKGRDIPMFVNELPTHHRNEESSNFSGTCKVELACPLLWIDPLTLPFKTLKIIFSFSFNLPSSKLFVFNHGRKIQPKTSRCHFLTLQISLFSESVEHETFSGH